MTLSEYSTEELKRELELRKSVDWPKYVEIQVYNFMNNADMDDIAEQLGFHIYNDYIKSERLSEINFPDQIILTLEVGSDKQAKIVAVNGRSLVGA